MNRFLSLILIFFSHFLYAQQEKQIDTTMLMMNEALQIEATNAINHMYNFKFDVAEAKFLELKAKYPDHPLPYYLMGLSNWWKMMPYPEDDKRIKLYAPGFEKYMDLSIDKAEKLYDKNEDDVEASFFLCAAHGLMARHHAESGSNLSAINHTRKVFSYFKKLNENNDLSPEFLFGSALFNYYAAWFKEEYPILSPILALFPKGDKALGIKQLKEVSYNAFWTRTEAQYFLMKIYYTEEDDDKNALPIAQYLAKAFPDNPYFQRMSARLTYTLGLFKECLETSEDIIYKINIGMPGYEETSGRYASFFLGRIYKFTGNLEKAKEYYAKTIVFAEQSGATSQNYYLYAVSDLAKIADQEKNIVLARQYYKTVLDNADRKNSLHQEAKDYLKRTADQK